MSRPVQNNQGPPGPGATKPPLHSSKKQPESEASPKSIVEGSFPPPDTSNDKNTLAKQKYYYHPFNKDHFVPPPTFTSESNAISQTPKQVLHKKVDKQPHTLKKLTVTIGTFLTVIGGGATIASIVMIATIPPFGPAFIAIVSILFLGGFLVVAAGIITLNVYSANNDDDASDNDDDYAANKIFSTNSLPGKEIKSEPTKLVNEVSHPNQTELTPAKLVDEIDERFVTYPTVLKPEYEKMNTHLKEMHPKILNLFKDSNAEMLEVAEGEKRTRSLNESLGTIIRNSYMTLNKDYTPCTKIHDKNYFEFYGTLLAQTQPTTKKQKTILAEVTFEVMKYLDENKKIKKDKNGNSTVEYNTQKIDNILKKGLNQKGIEGWDEMDENDKELVFMRIHSHIDGFLLPNRPDAADDFNNILEVFYTRIGLSKTPENFIMDSSGTLNKNVAARFQEIIDKD